MKSNSKLRNTIKYFYYFISLSAFIGYGYFYYSKKYMYNGLTSASEV